MVFPCRRAVIFVHGCFWHGHGCHLFKWPGSRVEFWRAKIGRNRAKETRDEDSLGQAGWRILTVWECALKGRTRRPESEILAAAAWWLRSGSGNMVLEGSA